MTDPDEIVLPSQPIEPNVPDAEPDAEPIDGTVTPDVDVVTADTETVGEFSVPVDPMDDVQCDSCQ